MNSARRSALAAVTAGVFVLFTAACGGATGAEDLLEDHGGVSSSARPPETPPSSSGTSSASPSKASSASPPSSPATCAAAKLVETRGPMCSRRVTVASFEVVRASCYVDTEIGLGAEGTLTAPCEGDGEAALVFGSLTFRGSVVSGDIDVCAGTEFVWQDGCAWTSAQRVSGSLSDGVLVFGYGEAPKTGEAGCATACTATGSLHM
jgi:hypothetical protein